MPYEQKKPSQSKMHAGKYLRTNIITANRETLLLMLYAGAIRFLKQAIEALEHGQHEEKNRWIIKTQEIITELRSTLDFKVGGDIANQLEALYIFISQRLIRGNLDNNVKLLQEALSVLSKLNEGWELATSKLRASSR